MRISGANRRLNPTISVAPEPGLGSTNMPNIFVCPEAASRLSGATACIAPKAIESFCPKTR